MGTFAYGDSYYGLRSYDLTTGVVLDASASLSATSSIPNVNYIVAIGADATITATSSASCSGESVIIEETDMFSYGSGLYGQNEYTQGDLQTIISATSSIASVSGERIHLASAISTATCSFASIGGFLANGQGTVTSTSGTTASAEVVGERSALISATSSVTSNATATYSDPVSITATSSASANAEKFFLESSDKFAYGTGLYGKHNYDEEDLQTIISATSVSSTCTASKVNLSDPTINATASNTSSAEKIHQEGGVITASSSSTTRAEAVYISSGIITSVSTFTQTTSDWRIRESSGIVSTTSGTLAVGREKWEVIPSATTTWTKIAA